MAITSEVMPVTSEVIVITSEIIAITSENFGRKGHFFRNLSFDKKKYINIFLKRKYIYRFAIKRAHARVHTREKIFLYFFGFAVISQVGRKKKSCAKKERAAPM